MEMYRRDAEPQGEEFAQWFCQKPVGRSPDQPNEQLFWGSASLFS
jgi:hypothetical protein